MMTDTDDDPELIFSNKSGAYMVEGVRLEVNIFCIDPKAGWSLEIVNAHNTSTTWDDVFASEQEAWNEFVRTADAEGPSAFFSEGEPLNRLQ